MRLVITPRRLALLNTYYLKAQLGRDVSVLFSTAQSAPTASAPDTRQTENDLHTSTLNVIAVQAQTGFVGRFEIYATARPTLACMGVSLRCNVDAIYFLARRPEGDVVPYKWRVRGFIEEGPVPIDDEEITVDVKVVDAPDWGWPLIFEEAFTGTLRFQMWWRSVLRGPIWWQWRRGLTLDDVPERRYAQVPEECNARVTPDSDQHKDTIFLTLAQAIVASRHAAGRDAGEHPIGAVLVGPTGAILSWGANGNSATDKSLHAEANCLRRYQARSDGRPIPEGSTLYTTLQPCEMCAAMIVTAARANVDVIYAERDPGIGKTALSIRPPEPRDGIAERRLVGGALVRPSAAVSLAERKKLFQKAAEKAKSTYPAFLAALDNAKEARRVFDTSQWPPRRVQVNRMTRAAYTKGTGLKGASGVVEGLAKEYKQEWDALKKRKDEFPRAPVDRYRTPAGVKAFLEALEMFRVGGRLEQIILRDERKYDGLEPSKVALGQARELIAFLEHHPEAL